MNQNYQKKFKQKKEFITDTHAFQINADSHFSDKSISNMAFFFDQIVLQTNVILLVP